MDIRDVDSNRAQARSRLSVTGTFQVILHSCACVVGESLEKLDYTLPEARTEYVLHGFSYPIYLAELRPKA